MNPHERTPAEKAAYRKIVEAMPLLEKEFDGALPDDAEAVLASLVSAIFPSRDPDRARLTWLDRPEDAARAPDPGAEARARAAEVRFRTLVEQIPAVTFMAVLGEGKNECYVSPHIEQMLGYTQAEWLEDPFLWYWRLHPDDRVLWNEEFARGCRSGGPFKAECRFQARDGRYVWVHGEARLVKDDLGRPLFLQGIAFDVSEIKRAQEVLLNEAVRDAKIEEELEIARRVQTSILPRKLAVEGLEIAASMTPASEVGGDYYDVLPFPGGAWLAIGDVSGHGLSSGLIMLMLQSAMSAIARKLPGAPPSEVLATVNEVLHDNIRSRLGHRDHVTLSLLRYTSDGRIVIAGAHEDLILLRRSTGRTEVVRPPGTWLGAMRDVRSVMVDTEIRLEPGDLLVLYTDGVTEARSPEGRLFDMPRLIAAVEERRDAPPQRVHDHILRCVRDWMAEQQDDISIVVIRYQGSA